MIKGILVGIILAVIGMAAIIYSYFSTGRAPVAVTDPAMPFERSLAVLSLHTYLNKLPHPESPVAADEPNMLAGAKLYRENCAVCHGVPDGPKTSIAEGMYPKPPQLFKGMGVTDDDTWESYWKINGGIRLTGMPGFKTHLNENQMWQIAVLVKNADKISPTVKAELTGVAAAPPTPAASPAPATTKKN
jgi:mono/diheme cytochrome c family protein